MSPKRIQRKRTKGWRMPDNAVYVGRPTKWGNPHKVRVSLHRLPDGNYRYMTPADAVAAYRNEILPFWTDDERGTERLDLEDLRGKDLACWCQLDQPCHADVLLALANQEPQR